MGMVIKNARPSHVPWGAAMLDTNNGFFFQIMVTIVGTVIAAWMLKMTGKKQFFIIFAIVVLVATASLIPSCTYYRESSEAALQLDPNRDILAKEDLLHETLVEQRLSGQPVLHLTIELIAADLHQRRYQGSGQFYLVEDHEIPTRIGVVAQVIKNHRATLKTVRIIVRPQSPSKHSRPVQSLYGVAKLHGISAEIVEIAE